MANISGEPGPRQRPPGGAGASGPRALCSRPMEAGQERAGQGGLRQVMEAHVRELEARLGPGEGTRCFFSPGRVNLMGAHLDYNGGPVMPMAIDRGTYLAIRPRADGELHLQTTQGGETFRFEPGALPAARTERWVDYPLGVLNRLGPGRGEAPGLDVLFGGDLPVAAGLSSSASICVGTAFGVSAVWELGLSREELVRTALEAERGFVGVQCGIMDPYAVGLARPGHVLWLDCKDESFEHLPMGEELRVAVADTGVRRELARGAFNQRVRECQGAFELLRPGHPRAGCLRDVPLAVLDEREHLLEPVLRRRARHVLEEVARTFAAREALIAGDPAGFGARMLASHRSLRELYEVSVPELDCLVEAGEAAEGCLGARLTGAGFGGCAVFLLERGGEEDLAASIASRFEARFGRSPRVMFFAGDPGPREVRVG